MDSYKTVLKRVGIVLIIIGLLDIGLMVYCILNKLSYSSSLNIFAVIGGIFLYRGNLNAARYITWFSAFLIAGAVGAIVINIIQFPFDLMWTYITLYPLKTIGSAVMAMAVVAACIWIYRQLVSDVVMEARGEQGLGTGQGISAFILAGFLVLLISVFVLYGQYGKGSQIALSKASSQYGDNFRYVIVGFGGAYTTRQYRLIAYNDKEIREITVEWDVSDNPSN